MHRLGHVGLREAECLTDFRQLICALCRAHTLAVRGDPRLVNAARIPGFNHIQHGPVLIDHRYPASSSRPAAGVVSEECR
jgi:hypothetical protein